MTLMGLCSTIAMPNKNHANVLNEKWFCNKKKLINESKNPRIVKTAPPQVVASPCGTATVALAT
jgi:hypothetical protein